VGEQVVEDRAAPARADGQRDQELLADAGAEAGAAKVFFIGREKIPEVTDKRVSRIYR
jgi:hypothetical protein